VRSHLQPAPVFPLLCSVCKTSQTRIILKRVHKTLHHQISHYYISLWIQTLSGKVLNPPNHTPNTS
jgi:hypothetical protein